VSRLDDALELVAIDSVSRGEAAIAHHVAVVLARNPISTWSESVTMWLRERRATTPHDSWSRVTSIRCRRREFGHDRGRRTARRRRVRHERFVGGDARAGVRTDATLVEVTWVFYAREEISRSDSGLLEIKELRPDLLDADAAILAEPTDGRVEAGCKVRCACRS